MTDKSGDVGALPQADRAVVNGASDAVSALRASVPSAELAARMREMGEFLIAAHADIPEPTCSSIDAVLREIAEPRKKAAALVRNKPDSRELEDFASEVDSVLWGLPDDLERLRHDNAELRDGVHHLGSYCHDAGRLLLEAAQAVEAFYKAPTLDSERWQPIETAPKDGKEILILAHGMAIQARYCPGEWGEDTPLGPAEYDGAIWCAFDDAVQFEIEEGAGPDRGDLHGPVTHWMPLPKPTVQP